MVNREIQRFREMTRSQQVEKDKWIIMAKSLTQQFEQTQDEIFKAKKFQKANLSQVLDTSPLFQDAMEQSLPSLQGISQMDDIESVKS